MPRPDALATAAAKWPSVRQTLSDFVRVLDSALADPTDGDPSDELTPEDVARVGALVARRRQRALQPRPKRNACV